MATAVIGNFAFQRNPGMVATGAGKLFSSSNGVIALKMEEELLSKSLL